MKSVLEASLASLRVFEASRGWLLPNSTLQIEVDHYRQIHKSHNHKSPVPRLRSTITEQHATEMALKVDAALNFIELGQRSDPLIKPILLYYGCAHLCGVWSRAFLDWDNDGRGHGLKWNAGQSLSDSAIEIGVSGSFPRTVVACFIMSGQPSCFTPLATFAEKPTERTGPGELLERFGMTHLGDPLRHVSLDDLVAYTPLKQLEKVRSRFGLHKYEGLPQTLFLLDFLTLFLGSSLARYDVLRWKEILEGETNQYRLHFDDVLGRFCVAGTDLLLSLIESPSANFGRNLAYGVAGPYSRYLRFS